MNYTLATKDTLKAALLDARSRTLSLVEGLSEEQLLGPILPTVNPLRWEIAHVAYFHEYWVLRHLGGKQPVRADVDELFDSISIDHESRWQLPLPSLRDTYIYMNEVLQKELFQLDQIELNKTTKYFYLLALFHEDYIYTSNIKLFKTKFYKRINARYKSAAINTGRYRNSWR